MKSVTIVVCRPCHQFQCSKEKKVNVRVEYIRCTDYTTEYQVIARLCQQMGQDVPYRGWTKAEVINAFRNLFKKNVFGKDLILIIILLIT